MSIEHQTDPGAAQIHAAMEKLLYEVKKTIVGQDVLLERLIVALLSRGHILVEGVPGLAKTMTIKTLASALGGSFQRVQFTPDLVPADLIGTRIWNQNDAEFTTSLGPVFANLVLADEINPRSGEGAERPAGSHAGTPGHHRTRITPGAIAVPGHGHPEPDRI